jgi:LmbE family N-acetylglucosaminyl deacetylase
MAMTAGELLDAAHRFPVRRLRERLEGQPFIVIAPHPDDESLACGGLIAEACRHGLRGKVVIVSDGAGSHPNSKPYPPDRLRALREEEARRAGAELGLEPEEVLFLGLADRFVPCEGAEAERAIGGIVDCVREIGARSLFVSSRRDPHCDHEASYKIAGEAQRRVGELRLFEYVVWGATLPPSTQIAPIRDGFRIRIDNEALDKKRRAISAHRSQTTNLIDDDHAGFRLAENDLARFDLPYEFFFESVA